MAGAAKPFEYECFGQKHLTFALLDDHMTVEPITPFRSLNGQSAVLNAEQIGTHGVLEKDRCERWTCRPNTRMLFFNMLCWKNLRKFVGCDVCYT